MDKDGDTMSANIQRSDFVEDERNAVESAEWETGYEFWSAADNVCMSTQRQPKGIPVGGQFAANTHDESAAGLSESETPEVVIVFDPRTGTTESLSALAAKHHINPEMAEEWAADDGYEIRREERIEVGEDWIDMDEVTQSYRDNGDHDIIEVGISPDADSGNEDEVRVHVQARANLLWNDEYTEEELDHYQEIVEDVYREWFDADVLVSDSWEDVNVQMTRDIPKDTLCLSTVSEAAWDISAKWHNETDPGTFGSPYIGSELRRRIDNARSSGTGVLDRQNAKLPEDMNAEKITGSEAIAISRAINTGSHEKKTLDSFVKSGVVRDVSALEADLDDIETSNERSAENGSISIRKRDENRAMLAALRRWVDDRPEFSKEEN